MQIKQIKKRFCSIEAEYGHPYNQYIAKWNWWRDKVYERVKNINDFEQRFDLEVNFEQQPKFKQISEILMNAEKQF